MGSPYNIAYARPEISLLRLVRYDGVINIEHEDCSMSKDEGLKKAFTLLNRVIIRERPGAMWWA